MASNVRSEAWKQRARWVGAQRQATRSHRAQEERCAPAKPHKKPVRARTQMQYHFEDRGFCHQSGSCKDVLEPARVLRVTCCLSVDANQLVQPPKTYRSSSRPPRI